MLGAVLTAWGEDPALDSLMGFLCSLPPAWKRKPSVGISCIWGLGEAMNNQRKENSTTEEDSPSHPSSFHTDPRSTAQHQQGRLPALSRERLNTADSGTWQGPTDSLPGDTREAERLTELVQSGCFPVVSPNNRKIWGSGKTTTHSHAWQKRPSPELLRQGWLGIWAWKDRGVSAAESWLYVKWKAPIGQILWQTRICATARGAGTGSHWRSQWRAFGCQAHYFISSSSQIEVVGSWDSDKGLQSTMPRAGLAARK